MNNKSLNILIGTGAMLALVSCGGGGGSSSGSSGDTTTGPETPKLKNVLNSSEVKFAPKGDGIQFTTVNGDLVVMEGSSLVVNGQTFYSWEYEQNIAAQYSEVDKNSPAYIAFTGKAGPTVIYRPPNHVPTTEEVLDTSYQTTEIQSPIADGQKSFTGINYQYSYSNPNGTWKSANNNDGVITYDPSKSGWSARFDGDVVKLDGQISGNNVVSGTATVNGITGEFNGYDAVYLGDTPVNEYGIGFSEKTHKIDGAFAGSDGSRSFGGVWSKTDRDLN